MWVEWLRKFRLAKLCSTAALALGATAIASVVAPAHASVTCSPTTDVVTAPGGSLSDPTDIGGVCGPVSITGDQDFPANWEFTWDAPETTVEFASSVTVGSVFGSFYGSLDLYSAGTTPVVIQSAGFETTSLAGSFAGETDTSMVATLADDTSYIIGIEPPSEDVGSDPPFTANFDPVPEPASLGLFGGAFAALGLLRKRRKRAT